MKDILNRYQNIKPETRKIILLISARATFFGAETYIYPSFLTVIFTFFLDVLERLYSIVLFAVFKAILFTPLQLK